MRKANLLLIFAAASAAIAFAVWDSKADAQSPPRNLAATNLKSDPLRTAASFASISDPKARSVALFEEAGKVITHPRCANCHPVDTPAQSDSRHPHMPMVARGNLGEHGEGHGATTLPCRSCHTNKNVWVGGVKIVTIPGNPAWALAPKEQAWQGKSLGEICRQIKDPARNGGKTLAQIQEHMARDPLVAWGWNPGAGRKPVPGTQAEFGEIIQAWIDSGAECPAGGTVVPSHDVKVAAAG